MPCETCRTENMGFPNPRWTCPKFAQPVSPNKKIPKPASQPYILLLPWHNHHFCRTKLCQMDQGEEGRKERNEFWGGGVGRDFFLFFPPFSKLEVWQHGSGREWWITRIRHEYSMHLQFLSACASVYGQQSMALQFRSGPEGPRRGRGGASTLGSLGPSQLLGKDLQSTTPKKF